MALLDSRPPWFDTAVIVKVDRRRAFTTRLSAFLCDHAFGPASARAIRDQVARGLTYVGVVGPRSKRIWTVRAIGAPPNCGLIQWRGL